MVTELKESFLMIKIQDLMMIKVINKSFKNNFIYLNKIRKTNLLRWRSL